MMKQLLNKEDLKQWAGIEQDAALLRWLDDYPPIPYKRTKGGEICTTADAVTAAIAGGKEFNEKWVA